MVDSLAEKPKFTDYREAFGYLTGLRRFIIDLRNDQAIDISVIGSGRSTPKSLFEQAVINYQTDNGHFEYVLGSPDSNKPGLRIERFDPEIKVISLSGILHRVSLGEREHTGYYEQDNKYLILSNLEDLKAYQKLRMEEGIFVADSIRRLINA